MNLRGTASSGNIGEKNVDWHIFDHVVLFESIYLEMDIRYNSIDIIKIYIVLQYLTWLW